MAATWRATAASVAFASAKSMIDVFNATGTARVIRVYRMFQFNNQTAAIAGVLTLHQVNRLTTSITGGSAVTPVKHDSNSGALDANTTAGTGRTVTRTDVFRRYLWATEEATTTGTAQANWELMLPNCEVWNAGYADTNIEPLVCRAAEGVEIQNAGSGAVGTNDLEIEFTDAAT